MGLQKIQPQKVKIIGDQLWNLNDFQKCWETLTGYGPQLD